MVFDFTQFWLDGRPGNEFFLISHKISDLLTPLTPLGVRPQWFETDLSHSSYSAMSAVFLVLSVVVREWVHTPLLQQLSIGNFDQSLTPPPLPFIDGLNV